MEYLQQDEIGVMMYAEPLAVINLHLYRGRPSNHRHVFDPNTFFQYQLCSDCNIQIKQTTNCEHISK